MKLISFGVERRGTCRAKTKTQQKTMKMNSFESDRGIKNVKKKCHTCFAVLEVYGTPKGGILFEEPAGLSSRTLDTKEQRHRVGNVGRILISLGVFFLFFFSTEGEAAVTRPILGLSLFHTLHGVWGWGSN